MSGMQLPPHHPAIDALVHLHQTTDRERREDRAFADTGELPDKDQTDHDRDENQ